MYSLEDLTGIADAGTVKVALQRGQHAVRNEQVAKGRRTALLLLGGDGETLRQTGGDYCGGRGCYGRGDLCLPC